MKVIRMDYLFGNNIRIINVNINGQEGLFLTKKNYKVFKIIEKESEEK